MLEVAPQFWCYLLLPHPLLTGVMLGDYKIPVHKIAWIWDRSHLGLQKDFVATMYFFLITSEDLAPNSRALGLKICQCQL